MTIQFLNFPQRKIALHSMMKFFGHETVRDADHYEWSGVRRGRQEFILWQHTLAGIGALRYEDREYELPPGTSMLLHFPHDHIYYKPEDGGEWEFLYAGFNGYELIRIARELERQYGPVHLLGADSPSVQKLREVIQSPQQFREPFLASARAYELICTLAAEISSLPGGDSCPLSVRRAINLVVNSPGDPPDIDAMAAAADMSRWHFSRIFKAATGFSPGEFVRSHTLRRAALLLQTSKASIKMIAEQCGFATESSFVRAFKQAYGYPPGTLRRQ